MSDEQTTQLDPVAQPTFLYFLWKSTIITKPARNSRFERRYIFWGQRSNRNEKPNRFSFFPMSVANGGMITYPLVFTENRFQWFSNKSIDVFAVFVCG